MTTKASLIDLNGNEMILDADGDTTITADTDDQIDIKVAGTDTVVISGGAMALKGATPTFTIGDGGAEDTKIIFDGNTVDYHIGLDDSQDDLIIGKGTTLGSDPAIQINADERVGLGGAPVTQLHVMGGNGVIFDNPNNGYSGLKITDDTSGDYNINFLAGRSQGNTKFKFFRYGRDQNVTPWSDYSSPIEIAHISGNSNYFAGKVGIGTTTITSSIGWTPKLVLDATSAAVVLKGINNQENAVGVSNGFYLDSLGSTTGSYNNFYFRNTSTNSSFSASERMRIDASGYMYVGTISRIISGTVNAENVGVANVFTGKVSNNAYYNFAGSNSSGSTTFYARGDGDYYFAGTSQSDRDLKENIQPINESSLAKVKLLEPKTFNFKESEGYATNTKTGFIAQEVAEIFGTETGVASGTDGKKDMGIDTTGIVAHLTKAIQEQQEQIESLQQQIEVLKNGN
tara:strand:+ start:1228 stop:2598 length:1371 start_codon:yes stop_codon:yes gene_type:complete